MIWAYSLYVFQLLARVLCCNLAIASGVHMWSSPRARQAYSPPPASSMVSKHRVVAKGGLVHADGFFGDFEHANAFHAAGGAGEVLADGFRVQTDGLEQLRPQ